MSLFIKNNTLSYTSSISDIIIFGSDYIEVKCFLEEKNQRKNARDD